MKRTQKRRLQAVNRDGINIMRNPELLIKAVEKHPCLWDVKENRISFRKEQRNEAWISVCEEIYQNWHTMDEDIKRNKRVDLKKKWTHIRDYYRRDFVKNKNLSESMNVRRQKRYIFADLLHFLAPQYDKSLGGKNMINGNESDSTTQEELEPTRHISYDFNHEPSMVEHPLSTSDINTTLPLRQNSPSPKLTEKRKTKVLNENPNPGQQMPVRQLPDEDNDTKFLLSLRGDLQHFSQSQKLDFKIGTLQLIQKIMYGGQMTEQRSTEVELEQAAPSFALKMSPEFSAEYSQHSFDDADNFSSQNGNL